MESFHSSWLCLFTEETWTTATSHNFCQAAFSLAGKRAALRIRNGDELFAYITGRQRLAGILIARSMAQTAPSLSIFEHEGRFPVILQSEPSIILSDDSWIPIERHITNLRLFRGLRNRKNRHHAIRNSPKELARADREYLSSLILAAKDLPLLCSGG